MAKITKIFKRWSRVFCAALTGAVMVCAVSAPAAFSSANAISVRGIVEGFYGTPWTHEERLDMLAFCGQHGFNAYIYAPKDDPYHREQWREPYPTEKLTELGALVRTADENNVRFIFALSPGLSLSYDGNQQTRDRLLLRQKFDALYNIGVRDFAVFFDDIKDHNAKGQTELLAWLAENFVAERPDVRPLIAVPTEYFLKDMTADDGAPKEYTETFAANLPPDVVPLFTGSGVVCPALTDEDVAAAEKIYGRKVGVWHNYPVSDYLEAKLALGAVDNLPQNAQLPCIFFNPMKYAALSKIALATAADYAQDPARYDAQSSWRKNIAEQYGALAEDMLVFADHSQKMENSWANIGKADGAEMRAAMDNLLAAYNAKDAANFAAASDTVRRQATQLLAATKNLQKHLPSEILAECRPQLSQAERIATADLTALDFLAAKFDGKNKISAEKLQKKLLAELNDIKTAEKDALFSEKTARLFIDEVLNIR